MSRIIRPRFAHPATFRYLIGMHFTDIVRQLARRDECLALALSCSLVTAKGDFSCEQAPRLLKGIDPKRDMRFKELAKIAQHLFGKPRQRGTSHMVYPVPWPGLVVIQDHKGKAKRYQVKQVEKAAKQIIQMECGTDLGAAPPSAVFTGAVAFKVLREGSDYVAISPQVPGLSWYGTTKEDALEGAQQVLKTALR